MGDERLSETEARDVDQVSAELAQYFMGVVMVMGCGLVSVLGIVTNVINITVFVKQRLQDSVNISLLGMTLNILIICTVIIPIIITISNTNITTMMMIITITIININIILATIIIIIIVTTIITTNSFNITSIIVIVSNLFFDFCSTLEINIKSTVILLQQYLLWQLVFPNEPPLIDNLSILCLSDFVKICRQVL